MKYKVGDKVRVRKGLDCDTRYYMDDKSDYWFAVPDMIDMGGEIVTIRFTNANGRFYHIDGSNSFWTDEMFEPVDTKPTFKIGDKVRVISNDTYVGSRAYNETATVIAVCYDGNLGIEFDKVGVGVHNCGQPCVERVEPKNKDNSLWVTPCEIELFQESKEPTIIISTDGKTTTARLFEGGDEVKSATATCHEDDEFDFTTGAKLAFERLTTPQPTKPKFEVGKLYQYKGIGKADGVIRITKVDTDDYATYEIIDGMSHDDDHHRFHIRSLFADRLTPIDELTELHGFKLGERVNYEGVNGTVICFATGGQIGVEFDENDKGVGMHRCTMSTLIGGKRGTTDRCKWFTENLCSLNHGELPKYYNGKVVPIKLKWGEFAHIWTIGKVYEVKDGIIHDDKNNKRRPKASFEQICIDCDSAEWLEIVE